MGPDILIGPALQLFFLEDVITIFIVVSKDVINKFPAEIIHLDNILFLFIKVTVIKINKGKRASGNN